LVPYTTLCADSTTYVKIQKWCTNKVTPQRLKDAPGQRLLEARSFEKVQPMDDATTYLMLAIDNDNFIALGDDDDE
jgi:hypothetical protein